MRKSLLFVFSGLCCALAQDRPNLLDVNIVKVKTDKFADFDAMTRKAAEANRKNKGDRWLAYHNEFGDQTTVTFATTRTSFAAIETGMGAFEAAMKESFGPAMPKLFADYMKCLDSSRSEVRLRRWDLSWNAPQMAELNKVIGQSRFLYITSVRVRTGHTPAFEESARLLKEAAEKNDKHPLMLVSQSAIGSSSIVFYYATFLTGLAGVDTMPRNKDILGDRYQDLVKSSAENIVNIESNIARWAPELSNPPDEIASADPKFWTPKPAMAPAKSKSPKPADTKTSGQ